MGSCTKCGHENPDGAQFCAACGNPLTGTSIGEGQVTSHKTLADGRYTLHKLLGSGGMGEVWEAHDSRMDIPVAVKLLHASLLTHPTAKMRTLNEAKALAKIGAQGTRANVIRIYDFFEHEGSVVLVLELVRDGDLGERLARGALDWKTSAKLMQQILGGLQSIHQAGLVHRDLKPGNILMEGELPLITDLGVAHDEKGRSTTRTGALLGTPTYMSPEQIRGKSIDARSDLYSAGVLFFELLSGRPPFNDESEFDLQRAHVEAEVPLEQIPSQVPRGLLDVLAVALAKAPEERYSTAAEMAQAIERAAVGGADAHAPASRAVPGPAPRPQTAPQTSSPRADLQTGTYAAPRKGSGMLGWVIGLLVIGGLFAFFAMNIDEKKEGIAVPKKEAAVAPEPWQAAKAAYEELARAWNEQDEEAYFQSFAFPLCWYNDRSRTLKEQKSGVIGKHFREGSKTRLRTGPTKWIEKGKDRVVFEVQEHRVPKLIEMRHSQDRWVVTTQSEPGNTCSKGLNIESEPDKPGPMAKTRSWWCQCFEENWGRKALNGYGLSDTAAGWHTMTACRRTLDACESLERSVEDGGRTVLKNLMVPCTEVQGAHPSEGIGDARSRWLKSKKPGAWQRLGGCVLNKNRP